MNIIIVGCGKVGYTLVEQLGGENHNITVIDTNEEKVKNGRNILSAETYIELFRNTIHGNHGKHRIRNISRDAGKSTDLLWEVEHGQPASDLSAKEKRFLESDRGQSTGGM